jgi:hypothetical protein
MKPRTQKIRAICVCIPSLGILIAIAGCDPYYHYDFSGTVVRQDGVTPLSDVKVVVAGDAGYYQVNPTFLDQLKLHAGYSDRDGHFSGRFGGGIGVSAPKLDRVFCWIEAETGWQMVEVPLDDEMQQRSGFEWRALELPPITIR